MSKPNFHIIINGQSGTVKGMGVQGLEQKIVESDIGVETLHICEPEEMSGHMIRLKDAHHPILIGGGDGTIRSCADTAMKHDMDFGIIPLGTMNLLARDLGISTVIDEALGQYNGACASTTMDVGMVNNHIFLCCAGIGTMPEASHFREENRDENLLLFIPQLANFIMQQMDAVAHTKMFLEVDKEPHRIKTAMLVVSNNQYKSELNLGADNFNRYALDKGVLGVYSVSPKSLWDKIRVLTRFAIGDWKQDAKIREWVGRHVKVETGMHSQDISLDGEIITLHLPFEFSVRKQALGLITPVQQ